MGHTETVPTDLDLLSKELSVRGLGYVEAPLVCL